MVDNTQNQKQIITNLYGFLSFCRTQKDDVYTTPFHAKVSKEKTL